MRYDLTDWAIAAFSIQCRYDIEEYLLMTQRQIEKFIY